MTIVAPISHNIWRYLKTEKYKNEAFIFTLIKLNNSVLNLFSSFMLLIEIIPFINEFTVVNIGLLLKISSLRETFMIGASFLNMYI